MFSHFTKQFYTTLLVIAIGGSSLSLTQLCARQEISSYKKVRDEYLQTFAQEKKEADLSKIQTQENNKKELRLVVEELSNYTLHDLVTSMFVQQGKLQAHHGIIDHTFIRKMELLCGGENTNEHLLGHLIHSDEISAFGKVGFASILINPTTDIVELKKRQEALAIFNSLLADNNTHQELNKIFNAIKDAQGNVLRYWEPEPEMNKDLLQRLFFPTYFNRLNKSTVALEIATRLRNLGTTAIISAPLISNTVQNALAIYSEHGGNVSKTEAIWEGFKKNKDAAHYCTLSKKIFKEQSFEEIFNKNSPIPWEEINLRNEDHAKLVQLVHSSAIPNTLGAKTLGDDFHLSDTFTKKLGISPTGAKAATLAFYGIVTALYLNSVKNIVNESKLNTLVTNHIHERLIAVSSCIRQARNLYTLLQSYEATATMPAVQQLATFFDENGQRSTNLSNLLAMLQTNTFNGKSSFFSITGRVLATHTLMHEVKDELIPLFEAVGHIEAYLAAAKLIANQSEPSAKFCFADYIEADEPTIIMKSFWNPFINPNVVVTNDVVFNAAGTERNVILTGPNTAGKSTVIKGVALNILLAQSFGICAAEYAQITPFSIINCHLNITDDIATGSSLFQAEVKRAKALLDDIQSLKKEQFCFTIMDEVFNGTNAEGGSDAAYKFSDQLGQFQNLILVVATHFPLLTQLDKTGNFRNLHVGAYLDELGNLQRPFKLQTGIFSDPENKILHAILEREGIHLY